MQPPLGKQHRPVGIAVVVVVGLAVVVGQGFDMQLAPTDQYEGNAPQYVVHSAAVLESTQV
ncbi:MAG: hypothetical protein ACK5XN_35510 [Bacteroidota bacterium]